MSTQVLLPEPPPDEQRRRTEDNVPTGNVAPRPRQLVVTCENPREQREESTGSGGIICIRLIVAVICVLLVTLKVGHKNSTSSRSYYSDSSPSSTYYSPSYTSSSSSNNYASSSVSSGLEVGCKGQVCKDTANEIIKSLNQSVDPCDNFYDFACQGWHHQNPRPEYMADWSVFNQLELETMNWVVDILTEPGNDTERDMMAFQQAKRYFKTCMNVGTYQTEFGQDDETVQYMLDTVEEYGGWPMLYPEGKWNGSNFDLLKSVADLIRRFGSSTVLDISPYQIPYGANENVIMIRPPASATATGSVISTEYWDALKTFVVSKAFIVNVSRELLHFMGVTNISEAYLHRQARDILFIQADIDSAAERKNFKGMFGFTDNVAMNTTLEKIQAVLNGHATFGKSKLDLKTLLDHLYSKTDIQISRQQQMIVSDLDYLLGISGLMSELPTEEMANYLHFQMIFQMLPLVPSSKLQGYFDTLNNFRFGTTEPVPRRQTCAVMVRNSAFVQARRLFANVKKALSKLLSSGNILLSGIPLLKIFITEFCLGFPTRIQSKSFVEIEYRGLYLGGNFLAQTITLNAWLTDKRLKTLQTPRNVDQCNWIRFIGTVGAYNRVLRVYVPLRMLRAPMFDTNLPKSLVYGKLGSILGHELSHSLAGEGWTETKDGSLTPLSKCMITNYNHYTFQELNATNVTLNGEVTLQENVADNAGILAAYKAFKTDSGNRQKHGMVGLEKYTEDQVFFIGFAQNWCASNSLKNMKTSLTSNDHSPGRFRVLGTLQNSKEFAQAWYCPAGSNMNPVPTNDHQRCKIF